MVPPLLGRPYTPGEREATATSRRPETIVVDAMNSREDLGDRLSSEIVTEELRGARVVTRHRPVRVF